MIDASQLPTDPKDLTPEQRICVVLKTKHGQDPLFVDGLKYALELAAQDGWKHIAPAWLEQARSSSLRQTLSRIK